MLTSRWLAVADRAARRRHGDADQTNAYCGEQLLQPATSETKLAQFVALLLIATVLIEEVQTMVPLALGFYLLLAKKRLLHL